MRALTLHRPWHVLILRGYKLAENRPWAPRPETLAPGERFALHAGKGWDDRAVELARKVGVPEGWLDDPLCALDSAIVGTVKFEWVAPPESCAAEPWWMGPGQRLWRLSAPRPLPEPDGIFSDVDARAIPCRGALGLWRLPKDVESKLRALGELD